VDKYIKLFNTIKYLKTKQIYFRLFYFARARLRRLRGFRYQLVKESTPTTLTLNDSIVNHYSSCVDNTFTFLNLSKNFEKQIDWNYAEYGKLWTYNLTYFEYLKTKEDIQLIYDFIEKIESVKDGLEPFPISLRGINWIKFLTKFQIEDKKIDDSLYAQYYILQDNLEYHLLGNHLLENGFSLLFGAYYFQDEVLYTQAKEILQKELEEQILDDGAHFELSPMYHQIMLFRVLDCINLVQNNMFKNQELLDLLRKKASLMLGWLEVMTYNNGDIPLLNDSANGIAPTSRELFEYANRLQIGTTLHDLHNSGYRKVTKEQYECVIDVGNIGPDYIPGHAHSDTFNFVVHKNNQDFIVDTGLSTYETNERRTLERSTASHNTVEVNSKDQSEVWGGFRVANRAKIIALEENSNVIEATHDGYRKENVLHTRKWTFEDQKIIIEDYLNKPAKAIARVHFHPDILKDEIIDAIKSTHSIEFSTYKYAPEFNKLIDAICVEITFEKNLKVEIEI